MKPAIMGIAGWKNSGKTTLAERLIAELTARGWRVSSVKHAHHGFDIDREGTDSFRHRAAGATETAIVSSRRWALMHEGTQDEDEPPLEDILAKLAPCDIVIAEGFKTGPHAKIETRRLATKDRAPLCATLPGFIAIAADHPAEDSALPVFALDDIAAIASFVEQACGLRRA
ncbi:MAG: molybdopterin-guanine dinucleotide biosynthesis protein B [Brucellaceae bacterium]|nr:molybdopterin-guanine dinucleotide biosynthesis protein B [Brucellaceae bacterium]